MSNREPNKAIRLGEAYGVECLMTDVTNTAYEVDRASMFSDGPSVEWFHKFEKTLRDVLENYEIKRIRE